MSNLDLNEFNSLFRLSFDRIDWRRKLRHTGKKISVLIVDDEKSFRELLIDIFDGSAGFKADSAKNGKIAYEMYKKNKYDVVLTDIMMDTMTGVEMAEKIRREYDDPKVFFFSGWFSREQLVEKFEDEFDMGTFQFIEKPFDIIEFQNIIYLFENSNLKGVTLDLMDYDQINKISEMLSAVQLRVINNEIFEKCEFIFEKLEDELSDSNLDLKDFLKRKKYVDFKINIDESFDENDDLDHDGLYKQIIIMAEYLNALYRDYYDTNFDK